MSLRVRRTLLHLGTLAVLGGCSTDRPLSPATASAPALNVVPPAKAYTATIPHRLGGYLSDINDRLQVAGWDGLDAYIHDVRSSSTSLLPKGGWHAAQTRAINAPGDVGGFVSDANFVPSPAVWEAFSGHPVVLHEEGWVYGLNDRMIAVGSYRPTPGVIRAFIWNVNTGAFDKLPVPKGTVNSFAEDINNDNVIIGSVDVWGPVVWRPSASGYTITRLVNFSSVSGIDGGLGVVGTQAVTGGGQRAVFGSPQLLGAFLGPESAAYDVNGWGIAVGTATTPTGVYLPWIGDRSGTITYLPHPTARPGTASAHAVAVNNCGFAVGIAIVGGVYVPTLWDPGC
jgi:uncharacterized membrane protein